MRILLFYLNIETNVRNLKLNKIRNYILYCTKHYV